MMQGKQEEEKKIEERTKKDTSTQEVGEGGKKYSKEHKKGRTPTPTEPLKAYWTK